MRVFLLLSFLLTLATPILSASEITVGFENLQSVCGQQTYVGCNVGTTNPYRDQGLEIRGGVVENQLFIKPDGSQTIFPFGSYYLNLNPGQDGSQILWDFVNPYAGYSLRNVTSVSFLVLGKDGDVITRQNGTSGVSDLWPNNRVCTNPSDCVGWLNGFEVAAVNTGQNYVPFTQVVDPIPYGQAGYATGPQDFANIRVTISAPSGFDRLVFFQHPTTNDLGQSTYTGMIAIDQITFEVATPEPGTFVGAGVAIASLIAWRRRQSARQNA